MSSPESISDAERLMLAAEKAHDAARIEAAEVMDRSWMRFMMDPQFHHRVMRIVHIQHDVLGLGPPTGEQLAAAAMTLNLDEWWQGRT